MKKIINLERFIKNRQLREWIEALIVAGIVALIFRTWIYSPFKVPTGSMIPTIQIGDYLFANMHAYGLRVPFTDYKLFESKVERGDIIIFPSPEEGSDLDYIKRAIAIGGDEVEFKGEDVYINGQLEPSVKPFFNPSEPPIYKDTLLLKTPNCRKYYSILPKGNSFTVPQGKIWAMGDNRRNSSDSRCWGLLDESTVFGKGILVFWNHDPNQNIFSGYQLNRIGTFLE